MKPMMTLLLMACLCVALMAADEPNAKESKKGDKVRPDLVNNDDIKIMVDGGGDAENAQ